MDNSIAFYEKLGFVLTRKNDNSPAGNRLAFLELEGSDHFLELCYSPDFVVKFPEDLMHTCVGVEDIIDYCDSLENQGIEIWPDNWREKFKGKECVQVFLHYNNRKTPGAKQNMFDKRMHLGLPSWFKR